MPLGEEYGGATYFMLETHYDNPAVHKDILDSSGKRLELYFFSVFFKTNIGLTSP